MDIRALLNLVSDTYEPQQKIKTLSGSILKELHEHAQILQEGRAEQYQQMMDVLTTLDNDPAAIKVLNKLLNLALTLKRDDRIVWALRLIRGNYATNWMKEHENDASDAQRALVRKLTTNFSYVGAAPDRTIKLIASHFLAIPYGKIQSYPFPPNATPAQIVDHLEALEQEFKEKTKGLVTQQPGDEIILKFPNGYCWMKLSRGGCAEEAAAMGHCGNGAGSPGEHILSLRVMRKEDEGIKYYEPFLTFILESDGFLGEMKGKNNDKPIPKYHPYIIALLKLPIIKGIRGGGYLPKNNFALSQLTEEERNQLLDIKPELGGLRDRYDRGDAQMKAEVLEEVIDTIGRHLHVPTKLDGGSVLLTLAPDRGDFIMEFGSKETRRTWEFLENGELFEHFQTYDDDAEHVYRYLPAYIAIAIANQIPEGDDDEDEDELDRYDTSDVIRWLRDNDNEIYNNLLQAAEAGMRSGSEAYLHKRFIEAIKAYKPIIGTLDVPDMYDAPIELTLTPERAIGLIGDIEIEEWPSRLEDFFDGENLEVDSNNSEEFDEKEAVRSFIDTANLELPPIPEYLGVFKEPMIRQFLEIQSMIPSELRWRGRRTKEDLEHQSDERVRKDYDSIRKFFYGDAGLQQTA